MRFRISSPLVVAACAVFALSVSVRADKPIWAGGNGGNGNAGGNWNGGTGAPGKSDIAHIDNGKAAYDTGATNDIGALELTFNATTSTTGAIGGTGTVTFGGTGLASSWD